MDTQLVVAWKCNHLLGSLNGLLFTLKYFRSWNILLRSGLMSVTIPFWGNCLLSLIIVLLFMLFEQMWLLLLISCGSSGRTAEKSHSFKSDQVKVKQEPGTEEEICSFSGAVKQEKTEDGRRSACMVSSPRL